MNFFISKLIVFCFYFHVCENPGLNYVALWNLTVCTYFPSTSFKCTLEIDHGGFDTFFF